VLLYRSTTRKVLKNYICMYKTVTNVSRKVTFNFIADMGEFRNIPFQFYAAVLVL